MAQYKRPDAIIFDWDNTLIDSWRTIHAALVETFHAMGQEAWTLEETKVRARKSLRDSFPGLFDDRWKEAETIFYQAFEKLHIEHLSPMTGAHDMLARVSNCIPTLGVISNKTGRFLRKESTHLNWDGYFSELIGAGDASRDKPDAAPVELFRKNNNLNSKSDIWFIGDADIDLEMAVNSGCLGVLIHTKKAEMAEIVDFSPEIAVSDCEELAALVETL